MVARAKPGRPPSGIASDALDSQRMSILIKGGRVITAADDYVADLLVDGERISLIGESLDAQADRTIDASGKYVLPGCVDPHTHLDMPFGGTVTIDDVESGQTAAAFGGTTTHVDFIIQPKGSTFAGAIDEWRAKANGKQVIDMGYHMAITDLGEGGTLEELAGLPDQGITSYKLFMAYKGALMVDDETLFRAMEVAAESGALVMVHAENGDLIDVLVRQALEAGNIEPVYHALTRPPEAEGEATNRAIQLAHVAGAPLYVVHVTCREAVEPIARARENGWDVWGETCTQYFFTSLEDIKKPDFEGAKYVYSPPVRDKSNWDVLWNAVRTDALSAISTDHCAFLWDGQKTMGRDDFSKIPNGGPGLENRLHMIHEFGARAGRITLNRMVELLATNPAKLFGLYPRKGTIAVGSDADIVIFDPERRVTISSATDHSKTDYNLYEGTEVTGTPEIVLLRGNVLVEDGDLVAQPGIGQYVARARFGEELKPGLAVA
jgi:dihydropyrimidinase